VLLSQWNTLLEHPEEGHQILDVCSFEEFQAAILAIRNVAAGQLHLKMIGPIAGENSRNGNLRALVGWETTQRVNVRSSKIDE
jgi:hypothetical protein